MKFCQDFETNFLSRLWSWILVEILKHHALGVLDNDKKRGGSFWLFENRSNFYVYIVDDAIEEKADDSVDADVDVVD